MFGEMKRGLTVLKMRGSAHDKAIREFTIDKGGMQMGRPFRNVTGILAGAPVHLSPSDVERVWVRADSDSTSKERRRPLGVRRPARNSEMVCGWVRPAAGASLSS